MIRPFALLTALTLALYLALVWLTVTRLMPESGGLMPLDGRLLGYTPVDVLAFLDALSDEGRAVYLGPVRSVDTAFPLALGLWIAALIWRRTRGLFAWSRIVMMLPAGGYTLMDLCENALVADLLRAGAGGLDVGTARLASEFTITKYAMLGIALGVIVAVLLGGRRRRQEG